MIDRAPLVEALQGMKESIREARGEDQGALQDSLLEERFESRFEFEADYCGEEEEEGGEDLEELPDCPVCGGPGALLGKLGNRWHFRCRACGLDFSEAE